MNILKLILFLIISLVVYTNIYASQYDGVYEYVQYPEYCIGEMEVSISNDVADIEISTFCGEFYHICHVKGRFPFHNNKIYISEDDFNYSIEFYNDEANVIFSQGNEYSFGFCGWNAFMHGLYQKK